MSPRSAIVPRARRPILAALLGAAALAAAPDPAAAKTFVATFEDEAGDASVDARDVIEGRVAYNRKSGALSATVTMAGDIADESEDAVVGIAVSDLKNGKCRRTSMTMGVVLSDPSVPVAWVGAGAPKKRYYGTGSIDGDTVKMRVKAKRLSGKTPGCTTIFVTTLDAKPTLLDDTPLNNGFA